MKTIKGPAIFLAQFAADAPPFNTLDGIAKWAAGHGYVGVQTPSWDGARRSSRLPTPRLTATRSAEPWRATASRPQSSRTHLQGQLVAVIPPTISPSTASRPRRCAAIPASAKPGPSSS